MTEAAAITAGGAAAQLDRLRGWLASRGWRPFRFQEAAWAAFARGESGLVHVPTGAGKTYAAALGPLAAALAEEEEEAGRERRRGGAAGPGLGLRLLWITPLRAVSRDTAAALAAPLADLGSRLVVETRTGDTAPRVRARQRRRLPEVLVTTPESLSLLLTRGDALDLFSGLRAVVIDEWHELLGTKRGTQVELALARLRRFSPAIATWALTATLADVEEAARAAVGVRAPGAPAPTVVTGDLARPVAVGSVMPDDARDLPLAGYLGMAMAERVIAALDDGLDPGRSTLIFTNTRSQCERWHQAILAARPEWAPRLGIHHGSIDRGERERVERGLADGTVTLVVATSSLDLGVDFAPVERVFQVGSPKGVARLVQRAGRSGHRPGESCRVTCVPTAALGLVEIAAARRAIAAGAIERRPPLAEPLDALVQHLVTCGLGGGFTPDELYAEVRTAWSYRDLDRQRFDWALGMMREGGGVLAAYPDYRRLVAEDGRYGVPDRWLARLHRMNVGTITADTALEVRYPGGRRLGTVEESFLARLPPGGRFAFAARTLELVRIHDSVAYVKRVAARPERTPRWAGGRLPISDPLGAAVRDELGRAKRWLATAAADGAGPLARAPGDLHAATAAHRESAGGAANSPAGLSPETLAALPVMRLQAELSRLPGPGELLIESCRTREGHHLFVFPFEGRLVHEGLAAVLALRLSRLRPATFSTSADDYGFELLCPEPYPWDEALGPGLWTAAGLDDDIAGAIDLAALARRQFREVARVAGLVFEGVPGGRKSARQLQASAGLIYDVFARWDPGNPLLEQARREVIERSFERARMERALTRLAAARPLRAETARPTPLSYPLVVERLAARLRARSSPTASRG